jgi:hypothetical protein
VENGNKKNRLLTSFWVCHINLGAKLAALKTFCGWVARVVIVCIHVHECPSRHRHQEERRVLQFFFVAPCAACRSCAQRSHHAQLAGAGRRELSSGCVRESQYARGRGSPWCVSSFCLLVAGGVLVSANHAPAGSDILLWSKTRRSQESLGGRVREVCTDQRCSKSSPENPRYSRQAAPTVRVNAVYCGEAAARAWVNVECCVEECACVSGGRV